MNKLDFEILIDDTFINIADDKTLLPIDNKKILSLINDFENGDWRYSKFQNFVWDNIAETALSLKERESLIYKGHSSLVEAAKNLRLTDKPKEKGKGSELAEIVLYGIMKHHFNALPVVPKIFYKQNNNDYAKGADSVHIVVDDTKKDFTVWFGEAKFYDSIENARLDVIISSVETSLLTDKLKKENRIITNISDLKNISIDENIKSDILNVLETSKSIDILKPKLNIPILLLHECDITNKTKILTNTYKTEIVNYHKERANAYFKKQIEKLKSIHLYSEIKFHLILFPVPNKSEIVKKFISNVEHYKKQ